MDELDILIESGDVEGLYSNPTFNAICKFEQMQYLQSARLMKLDNYLTEGYKFIEEKDVNRAINCCYKARQLLIEINKDVKKFRWNLDIRFINEHLQEYCIALNESLLSNIKIFNQSI